MTALQISIATELACIARLPREDQLARINRLMGEEPDERVKAALKAEYHRIFTRRTAA
ncbi:hypothetical protein [Phyllobacterium phragmitis]|uniref:hypothetical protein n=1 Tax=Phyllobacterium phragmitis TaxID=2670329 RepID=UPI00130492E3|nr:hypothetical protein [Phyllobacterium phragmitis]